MNTLMIMNAFMLAWWHTDVVLSYSLQYTVLVKKTVMMLSRGEVRSPSTKQNIGTEWQATFACAGFIQETAPHNA